jgi:DNA replication and repair protein RecF
MHIEQLRLEEFRQYRRQEIVIPESGLAIFGANASGKSTLMEAIALLSTTRSPRTSVDREMIGWESGVEFGFPPFSRISASVQQARESVTIEIGLFLEHADATSVKKQIKLNGRPVRASTVVGQLRSVLFTPEDVSLITGPPSDRRRYLDLTICQLDSAYMKALSAYARVLSQRNSLLKQFARDGVSASSPSAIGQLAFWDDQLVTSGSLVFLRRAQTVVKLDELAREEYLALDGGELRLAYRPELKSFPANVAVSRESVALAMRESLEHHRKDEIRRGVTLMGPHRDDLEISIDGHDAGAYASRGQQRLAVLAMKLAEAKLMAEVGGEAPVVMLDDILSELDERHRGLVLETASAMQSQLLISSTDERLLDAPIVRELPRRRVESGQLLDVPVY